tara:strand:- start:80 stop:301 length:222 start_codon:yes stop_codon:yes gene_type:complete
MKKKLINKLLNLFELEKIDPNINIRKQVHWDSLTDLNLISFFDSEYEINISIEEIRNIQYVADIENIIKKNND